MGSGAICRGALHPQRVDVLLPDTHLGLKIGIRAGQPRDLLQCPLCQNPEFLVRPLELMESAMDVILRPRLARSLHRGQPARVAVRHAGCEYRCKQTELTDRDAGGIAAVKK
jgi:hypothetical protein